jgi:hypothetical protein
MSGGFERMHCAQNKNVHALTMLFVTVDFCSLGSTSTGTVPSILRQSQHCTERGDAKIPVPLSVLARVYVFTFII